MPASPRVGIPMTMLISPERQFVMDLGEAIISKTEPPSENEAVSETFDWLNWVINSGIPFTRYPHMDKIISENENLWVFAVFTEHYPTAGADMAQGDAYLWKLTWEHDTTLPWMIKPSDSVLVLRGEGKWRYSAPDEWSDEVFLYTEWNTASHRDGISLFAVPEADLRDFINQSPPILWSSPILNWSEMPWKLTHETLTSYSRHGWCPLCRKFGNWEIWGVTDETSAFQKDYQSKILAKEVSAYPTGKTVLNGNPQYIICLSCKATRGDDSLRRPDSLGDLFG